MTVKQKTPAVFDDDEIKVALTLIHGAGAHPLIPAGLRRVHRELSDHRQEVLLLDIKQQRSVHKRGKCFPCFICCKMEQSIQDVSEEL